MKSTRLCFPIHSFAVPSSTGLSSDSLSTSQLPLLPTAMSGTKDNLEGHVTNMRVELISAEKWLGTDSRTGLQRLKVPGLQKDMDLVVDQMVDNIMR